MATELAKAYVQIVPSARGIQGSITNALGGEAESAGVSAGKSFGGKMVSVLKGSIATAAIGKALVDTISEGAALQQSIGGIETLFKENADAVKKSAAEAYRTAGLSANDYMETVTSFSASLLQGLGGDTAKAASVADMAITDMSDNANKMGTGMDLIQNAYQGFAKQNYTMLDNLKLGYGGTKTEMERLLADAQKVSGVKYDISNLSDVYSAIHTIQGELEITGTTAKESASTISGSFASMKSAFKNVLADLALGNDMQASLSALAQTVTTFLVGNLLPAVWNILRALPGAVVTFIQTALPQLVQAFMQFIPKLQSGIAQAGPQLMNTAQGILNNFASGITAALPQVLERGKEMLVSIVNGIAETLPQLIQMAATIGTTYVENILAQLPQIIETGKAVLMSVVEGVKNSFPQIIATAGETIATLLSSIVTHLPEIISSGFDLIVSLIKGIGDCLPGLGTAAGEAAKTIWEAIKNIDWLQLGVDIVLGIVKGIGSVLNVLREAAFNMSRAALNAVLSFFGIHSPSRTMRDEVGQYIPAGVAVGVEENTKPISNAMKSLADQTTAGLQDNLFSRLQKQAQGAPAKPASEGSCSASGVVIQVYGASGQDERRIAEIVMEKIQAATARKEAAFA